MLMNSLTPNTFAKLHTITTPYTLISGKVVFITSLNKLQIQSIQHTYKKYVNTLKYKIVDSAIDSIDDVQFIELDDVYKFVIDISIPPIETLMAIQQGLMAIQDEKYQTPDYQSCEVCQDKGLDKIRNCPLLDKKKHSKSVVYTFKDNDKIVLRECPMYDINQSDIIQEALSVMQMLEHNLLPQSGGLLEQTVFFNEVMPLVKPLIDKKRQPII